MILFDGGSFYALSAVAIKHGHSIDDFIENAYIHILGVKEDFKNFGKLIICLDSDIGYWRSDVLLEYKKNRNKKPPTSDQKKIREYLRYLRTELLHNSPFLVVSVDRAEADDIIAIISMRIKEPHLIYSNDKDLLQLKQMQYSPLLKKDITNKENYDFITHIIRGDSSDGVPNIKSDDDTFINPDKRQTTITKPFVDMIKQFGNDSLSESEPIRYKRNKELIDLKCIPKWLCKDIVAGFINMLKRGENLEFKQDELQVFSKQFFKKNTGNNKHEF